MTKAIKLLTALPQPQRQRLMTLAKEVSFPEDTPVSYTHLTLPTILRV